MSLHEQKLYEKYFDKVYYILRNEDIAKDAIQETFIKVFKNLNKVKDLSKIESWIMSIATRIAFNIYNKKKKQKVVEFVEDNYASEMNEWDGSKDELERHLNHINPDQSKSWY